MKILNSFALDVVEHFPQEGRSANRASDEGGRRYQQEEEERAFLPSPDGRRIGSEAKDAARQGTDQ